MLEDIYNKIDKVNAEDPTIETWDDIDYPKELIYGQRMTEMLTDYLEDASFELKVAARGQHIRRWYIPRSDYPMDRKGYLKWRTMLKIYHGELLSEIMKDSGANKDSIGKVVELVNKKKLKTDEESKILEDVVCLVFLKFYFHGFASKHPEDKIISIVQKTWGKMTEQGHSKALSFEYDPDDLMLIQKALQG